jgi:hypothetical protein
LDECRRSGQVRHCVPRHRAPGRSRLNRGAGPTPISANLKYHVPRLSH